MNSIEASTVDQLVIALRAYAASSPRANKPVQAKPPTKRRRPPPVPSTWVVIFDTETTTDAGQSLRLGSYQVREGAELNEAGLFYEPGALSSDETAMLSEYAANHEMRLITRDEFVDRVFYGVGYDLRATIVGLNLPFDLSRLAIRHASARGDMRGGFSFGLSGDKRKPAVQVKHLSQKASLIRFAAPFRQRRARSERKRGDYVPVRRGHFVDVRTLAAALFSRSFGLGSLSAFLKVEHPKVSTDEHGGPLAPSYIEYAVRDVQTTWECYVDLADRFECLGLRETPLPLIHSEASLGKAYLKAMGIAPWRNAQPDFPPQMLANIMGSYFGGRSEVRIRRELRQVVLCDFLSMYPTVCTLMGLWRFVIADGIAWRDATEETRAFLETVTLADLQRPSTWRRLSVLVRVLPNEDIFPVRAEYSGEAQATIGSNHLSSDQPLWFPLADCIATKLLTGRAPIVVEAIVFEPGSMQSGLRPVAIAGNDEYRVDPRRDDFYKRLVELRQLIKTRRDVAVAAEKDGLDAEQNALKIAANATSYGIFVEVNVKDLSERAPMTVHSSAGETYEIEVAKAEEPGKYFHPLLATLITAAARLMLATSERLIADQGLEWAFCDTDSMAIAKPHTVSESDFQERVDGIVQWFSDLNPYDFDGSILKIEDVNFAIDDKSRREPLHCWAVSAKRYALFNLDANGLPVLRKASAHGLGHLQSPYDEGEPATGIPKPVVAREKLGVELWQHDLWWKIVTAALAGEPDQVDLRFHPRLGQPAVSRYSATTPKLLAWFRGFNATRSYDRQVKPFGFLYSLFANRFASLAPSVGTLTSDGARTTRQSMRPVRPAAPFDSDLPKAIARAFDRETGKAVPREALKSYRQVLAQFHLHPESKFLNGNFTDTGPTRRRHVQVSDVRNIGKEADHWEEQFFLGLDPYDLIDYGMTPGDPVELIDLVHAGAKKVRQRELARRIGVSRGTLSKLLRGAPVRRSEVLLRWVIQVLQRR
jgi:hypothetical protein